MLADLDRSDEHGIAANERMIPNGSRVLGFAIVIASDGASANVYVRAQGCVTDVAEMMDATPRAHRAGLYFGVVSKLHIVMNHSSWSEVAKRTDLHVVMHIGSLQN